MPTFLDDDECGIGFFGVANGATIFMNEVRGLWMCGVFVCFANYNQFAMVAEKLFLNPPECQVLNLHRDSYLC